MGAVAETVRNGPIISESERLGPHGEEEEKEEKEGRRKRREGGKGGGQGGEKKQLCCKEHSAEQPLPLSLVCAIEGVRKGARKEQSRKAEKEKRSRTHIDRQQTDTQPEP